VNWLGLLVIAPLWGFVSAQLLLQGWLAFAQLAIALIALARGKMATSQAAHAIAAPLALGLVASVVLRLGFWALFEAAGLARDGLAVIVYWVFALLSFSYLASRLPAEVRKSWRIAMNPDAIQPQGPSSPSQRPTQQQ